MNDEPTLRAEIALVESRLSQRRLRAAGDMEEVRLRVRRATDWLPVAIILAIAASAMVLGRRRPVAPLTPARGAGFAGALVALGSTALRAAMSPHGRALWQAIRAREGPGR
jgi:hypothetical protein